MSSHSMYRVLPPSEPPDGERSRRFRLAVVGGTQLCGSWYLSAIVRLQGFSSGSPAASPRRWSPEMVTTRSMGGRSKPGCDLCPALSFKDLHHPGWGGGRGEPEPVVPQALRCGGCSYPRGWNRSSICNGTLSAGVCSLWLSGPEHVGIFGCNTVFFPHF
jgi:hypothetical protein